MLNMENPINWCNKNGIFVYIVPIHGSEGKNRPNVRLCVKTPKSKKCMEREYQQNKVGNLEIRNDVESIYESYYNANKI